jgi:uroporphyrin-III C-methyltransferase
MSDICKTLGKDYLPVAIIQNGTTDKQKVGIGVAKDLEEIAENNQLSNPAVIIFGEVVKYANLTELSTLSKNAENNQ